MEMVTAENLAIVTRVYTATMEALHSERAVTADQLLIYDVEHLVQETNSGGSFEQFVRWASITEISRTPNSLRAIGLEEVANLTEKAMQVAFPKGLPSDPGEKDECTDNWTPEQEATLVELFNLLEPQCGHVENVLGEYAKRVGV